MRCSAILPAGLMGLVLLTACGGGQDSSAPPPTPSPTTVVAPASTTAAPTTAAPTTAASPTVPTILDFEADLIGGGTFRGADVAGGDTLFWFWAPT